MRTYLILVLLLSLAQASTSLYANSFDIGEQGSKIHLNGKWERKTLVKGGGKDQFFGPKSERILIFQILTPFDSPAASLSLLEQTVSNYNSIAALKVISISKISHAKHNGIDFSFCYMKA